MSRIRNTNDYLNAKNTESFKHQAEKDTSRKRQAPSSKRQASSRKRQAQES